MVHFISTKVNVQHYINRIQRDRKKNGRIAEEEVEKNTQQNSTYDPIDGYAVNLRDTLITII